MLLTKCFDDSNGFAEMTMDELFFINAGSGNMYGLTPVNTPSNPDGVNVSSSGLTIKDGSNTITVTCNPNPTHPSVSLSCSHSK
jgi:hypothetical protein